MASGRHPEARLFQRKDSALTMNAHPETDVERIVKGALARETMEAHRPSPGSSMPRSAMPTLDVVLPVARRMIIRTILAPTDFSPLATRAMTYAWRFAEQFGAQLILLHVTEPVTYAPAHCPVDSVPKLQAARREAAEEALGRLVGEIAASPREKAVVCRTMIVEGDVASETDRVAREYEADLIVIATHGYTGLRHLLLGSTAEKTVRHAPCPILVVREKERDFVFATATPGSNRAGQDVISNPQLGRSSAAEVPLS